MKRRNFLKSVAALVASAPIAMSQAGEPVVAPAGPQYHYTSKHYPFTRSLKCRECAHEDPIRSVRYLWSNFEFSGKCNSCGHTGVMARVDRRDPLRGIPSSIYWSPFEIIESWEHEADAPHIEVRLDGVKRSFSRSVDEQRFDPTPHAEALLRKDVAYLWDIPQWFRNDIKKGQSYLLEITPWEIVMTIQAGDNKIFEFFPGKLVRVGTRLPGAVLMCGANEPDLVKAMSEVPTRIGESWVQYSTRVKHQITRSEA